MKKVKSDNVCISELKATAASETLRGNDKLFFNLEMELEEKTTRWSQGLRVKQRHQNNQSNELEEEQMFGPFFYMGFQE